MAEGNYRLKNNNASVEQNLSDRYIPKGKLGTIPMPNNIQNSIETELKKKADKTKENIEKFKDRISKEYNFIEALGVISAQASNKIEEEFEISEENSKKKLIHILMIIPESKFKYIPKIKLQAIKIAKECEEKLWIHVLTPIDLWNFGMDSKFEVFEALAMSFPLIDRGILGALRVAMVHRTLVLKKFENYVTSYVVAGSLPRGEAKKTSDVDVFIIIDDTDVKRMPRLEIKEKLRAIIMGYIQEATRIAGVKNILNVQTYLLTEFWEAVKDAHPVMFTFIRDGVPLYDRGAFLPWKSLLRMGKIKPSPEAVDMFMSSGDRMEEMINRRLLDIAVQDVYWGVLTPSQGLLMLFGLAPPTPKETVKLIREVLVEKEKILEKTYLEIFVKVVEFYKAYEHGKIKKISFVELDKLVKDSLSYIKRLKELRIQIEKRVQEKSIEEIYKDTFDMLSSFLNKKSETSIINAFDKELIKKGKFPPRFLENLKFIAKVKNNLAKKKSEADKKLTMTGKQMLTVEKARRFSAEIINHMIEYTQRCEFIEIDKSRFILKGKNRSAEVLFLKDTFIIEEEKISKLVSEKLISSNLEELKKQISEASQERKIDLKALEILKKTFGDFDLVY